jgi:riboflavin kinase/FMN adenylyltransferase
VVPVAKPEISCAVLRYPSVVPESLRNGSATLGNFDGVHSGHAQLLKAVVGSDAGKKIVISFYPHPVRVLRGVTDLHQITSVRDKAEALARHSIDLLYLVHFTPLIAHMSASEFIQELFVRALGIRRLVVGEDAAVGRGREGTVPFLAAELPKYGIQLQTIPQYQIESVRPSSRLIRTMLQSGDVAGARVLLGRFFSLNCRITHGDGRGRQIGFPTANLIVGDRILPGIGVYACLASCEGVNYRAVANIGTRPTFNGAGVRLEVHLLREPPASLYGKRLTVSFVERVRGEIRFPDVGALQRQISSDVQDANKILDVENL